RQSIQIGNHELLIRSDSGTHNTVMQVQAVQFIFLDACLMGWVVEVPKAVESADNLGRCHFVASSIARLVRRAISTMSSMDIAALPSADSSIPCCTDRKVRENCAVVPSSPR